MSDSLRPHEHQASLSFIISWVCPNSCPLSWWFHPTISSSVTTFPSCPQSFPTSGSLPMSWIFTSDGQRIRASASVSTFPMNIQCWFPRGLTCLISLLSKGTLKSLLQHCSLKQSVLRCLAFFLVQLSQLYTTTRKTIGLTIWTFVDKVVSLLFNMLSRFVVAFLPRSKHHLIHGVHCGSTILKSWGIKNLMEDARLKIQ